jgi:hypothetical protein
MCENLQLCANSPVSSDCTQRCRCCEKSMNVTSGRVKHLVFGWDLSNLLQGILPTTQCFQGCAKSPLCNITPLKRMEEVLRPFSENSLGWKQVGPATCVTVWVEWSLQGRPPTSHGLKVWGTWFWGKMACVHEGKYYCMSVGQPQMLQERCSSTLFSSFKWCSMQKVHCLSVRVWQCEQFHLCANRPFPLNGTGTVSLASRCQGSQQELQAHCFPVRFALACERSACQMKAFDKGESFTPWKIPISEEIDQHL